MDQESREDGVARSHHVVHLLPADDPRVAPIMAPLVERVEAPAGDGAALRILVLAPNEVEVSSLASLLNSGRERGAVLVPASLSKRGLRRLSTGPAAVIATPETVQGLLQRSLIKLDAIESVVVVGLDAILARSRASLESMTNELPRGATRTMIAGTLDDAAESFLDAFAWKARRVVYQTDENPGDAAPLYVVSDRSLRKRALGSVLDHLDPAHATIVAEDVAGTTEALRALGYDVADDLVSVATTEEGESDTVIWLGLPRDVGASSGAGARVAILEPRELGAFLRLSKGKSRPLATGAAVERAQGADAALLATVRSTLEESGLHRELLSLAPLFAERDPAEVAAALARLYESASATVARARSASPPARREPMSLPGTSAPIPRTASPTSPPPGRSRAPGPAARDGEMARLFVGAGSRDGVSKGDLVGAITGESGITSDQIGKIDLQKSHAIVEVETAVADHVIESVAGKTIRGRVVSLRLDKREGGPPGRESLGRGGFARGEGGRGREGRGFGGGFRSKREGSFRDRDDRPRGGRDGGRGGPPKESSGRGPRRDFDGPRSFRDDRPREPRAIREGEEWKARGERLRNSRRGSPRRDGGAGGGDAGGRGGGGEG
ncbi:MAG: DbpA RNA binding domain-containing protein [Gemmatimonadota bacterium]